MPKPVRIPEREMTLAEKITAVAKHEAEAKRLRAEATAQARQQMRAMGEFGVPTWERIVRDFG